MTRADLDYHVSFLGAFLRVASYSDYEGGLDEGVGSAVTRCHNARTEHL